MTELSTEEWRNVHWVISPAVVCWLCQPWSRSLKPPRRVFQACSPDSQKHEHTRDAIGREGWKRQVRDVTLPVGWACTSPCCCHSSSLHHRCSPPLLHTVLACQPYVSSPALKGGRISFLHLRVSSGLLCLCVTLPPPKCGLGNSLGAWRSTGLLLKALGWQAVSSCFLTLLSDEDIFKVWERIQVKGEKKKQPNHF